METAYAEFLHSKIRVFPDSGFEADRSTLHNSLMPHQADTAEWAIRKGRALVASSFGLGKTRTAIAVLVTIHNHTQRPVLVICPLGVKGQFQYEDGPEMGTDWQYIRSAEDQVAATSPYHITNYERVRDGDIDTSMYVAVSLDEGSVLRSLGSDTTQTFIQKFRNTPFRYVFTATPSPNDYIELTNYSEFLGIMDRGQCLTRFFQRDSTKAGNLTLYPHHEADFWLWLASWAIFIDRPSDLGHSDEGYDLPPMEVIWEEVKVDSSKFGILTEKDGKQTRMFTDTTANLSDQAKVKRISIEERVQRSREIMLSEPNERFLIWHILEDERREIEGENEGVASIYGSQDLEERERRIIDFSHGRIQHLAAKPRIAGSGCNFQRHCARAIFMSVDFKFNDFIQAIHRIHRFLQPKPVKVWVLYTPEEYPAVLALRRKWALHDKQRERMREIILQHGLNHKTSKMNRNMGVTRKEQSGNGWTAIHNDSAMELPRIESNSVGLIHTSIPFGNHYEYSANYADFGHNATNDDFWKQMDFIIPELLRVTIPGRIAAIHVKDRIRYSTMTGLGSYTIDPFSDECIQAFRKHGWLSLARITILTDVVRENNQTYRLGHSEKIKDGSRMGAGLPEYLLIFRKPQTDLSKGFSDIPVRQTKEQFPLYKWQSRAHALWKSSGNRHVTPEEVAKWEPDTIMEWWKSWCLNEVFDLEFADRLAEAIDKAGKLPRTFMLLNPQSWSDQVWTDVNYMNGLNLQQVSSKQEKHICPLPFDIVDRTIETWSMEGDLVLDPFGGLMTVPVRAIKKKRRAKGIELSEQYWGWGCQYLKAEEYLQSVPTLFDTL